MKSLILNPTARVAVNRNVLKQYAVGNTNTVFVSDGTEFELELFNPTQTTIMCKITLNGTTQSDDLVLYPGQRVFLERYLDCDKKFLFKTYEVDENNEEVDEAIKNNGNITVQFFKEVEVIYYDYPTTTITINSPLNYNGVMTTGGSTAGYCQSTFTNDVSNLGITYTASCDTSNFKKETGIIDKGNKSDQYLSNVYTSFNQFPFHTVKIKILPDSQRIKTSEDIKYKKYCSNCGKKVNHKDKYCSFCGNKL
jgi:hypothetical protein